ncbi:hypothetical protein K461DRAFT_274078 [Myriangium duriaei CBS 260.36]|uniref:Uncharacterized protein n=1 Tax=Myriangium duriaei CBS 260.36 TaxID=1168546 RepID=A0A9P4JC15_9PEZI|nr:hypothetical protein K461DRAFT_274078 [Myriangium duriaei CBS 260.36]
MDRLKFALHLSRRRSSIPLRLACAWWLLAARLDLSFVPIGPRFPTSRHHSSYIPSSARFAPAPASSFDWSAALSFLTHARAFTPSYPVRG